MGSNLRYGQISIKLRVSVARWLAYDCVGLHWTEKKYSQDGMT